MERKSRRQWQYLFCFAESDFTPRQGHQHSAFVTAELQQALPVCRAVVGESVGALLGSASGEVCGCLKSFHPLLALPCEHVHTADRRRKEVMWCMRVERWRRLKVGDMILKRHREGCADCPEVLSRSSFLPCFHWLGGGFNETTAGISGKFSFYHSWKHSHR